MKKAIQQPTFMVALAFLAIFPASMIESSRVNLQEEACAAAVTKLTDYRDVDCNIHYDYDGRWFFWWVVWIVLLYNGIYISHSLKMLINPFNKERIDEDFLTNDWNMKRDLEEERQNFIDVYKHWDTNFPGQKKPSIEELTDETT